MRKIIGVTVGTPLSVSTIEERLKPAKKEYAAYLDKRITNIEKGLVPESFVTDSSVAYTKDVPADACPYAEITRIGGTTHKVGNILRSAPVTEVESAGANMLNPAEIRKGYYDIFNNGIFVESVGEQWRASGKIACFPSTYYILSNITLSSGYWVFFDNGDNLVGYSNLSQSLLTVQTPANCTAVAFYCNMSGDGMLNKGSTAMPYAPYTRNTLPIPEAVQALDGYGEGVNESVYNYIDYEKKQLVKRVGKVDLGTLDWVMQYNEYLIAWVDGRANGLRNFIAANGEIAPTYTGAFGDTFPNGTWGGMATNPQIAYRMKQGAYPDAATFKAAMSGVMLVYELATPEVTDISDILPADNYIGVEGGGTLTFKNEYEYDVPSEVTYQIKGAIV